MPRRPRRVHPPSLEQVQRMADRMASPDLRAVVLTAAWSGLRQAEVLDLQWRDVEPLAGGRALLHVRHGKYDKERWSVLYEPGYAAIQEIKTAVLRVPDTFLWGGAKGGALPRTTLHKAWTKAWQSEPDLADFWFHDLRKFNATWLLNQGVSHLDVAVQLGHIDQHGRPDPELVRKVYGFVDLDSARERLAAHGRAAAESTVPRWKRLSEALAADAEQMGVFIPSGALEEPFLRRVLARFDRGEEDHE